MEVTSSYADVTWPAKSILLDIPYAILFIMSTSKTELLAEADESVPDRFRRLLEAYRPHVEYRRACQDASE